MKRFLVDTSAMVIFSTLLGAFVEMVVAGLEPTQSISIRLAAIPVMLVAGRPYGLYRDKLFEWFGGKHATQVRLVLIDTVANMTFQLPLYLGLLAWGGASPRQMLVAASSILVLAGISGRPYGVFLNYWRRLFGLSSLP